LPKGCGDIKTEGVSGTSTGRSDVAIGTSIFGTVGYPIDVKAKSLDITDGATDPIKN